MFFHTKAKTMTWNKAKNINISKEEHHRIYGAEWSIGLDQYNYLKSLGLKSSDNVCDIGCGVGRFGIHVLKFLANNRYVGIDGSKASLDIFKNYEIPMNHLEDSGCNLYNIDITKEYIPASISSATGFHFIIAFSVYNHISNHSISLDFIYKNIAEDGLLITTFAAPKNYKDYNLELIKTDTTFSTYGNQKIDWFVFTKSNKK